MECAFQEIYVNSQDSSFAVKVLMQKYQRKWSIKHHVLMLILRLQTFKTRSLFLCNRSCGFKRHLNLKTFLLTPAFISAVWRFLHQRMRFHVRRYANVIIENLYSPRNQIKSKQ